MGIWDLYKIRTLLAITPIYARFSLVGGSILFWCFFSQTISGLLLTLIYTWTFESGGFGVVNCWWETWYGSVLIRLHSEGGNLVFLFLYVHILIKLWVDVHRTDIEAAWISGCLIFVFMYLTGLTGAMMPLSMLSEVTSIVIGSAISSLTFLKFDFLETLLIPGFGLNDDMCVRVFIVHSLTPILTLLIIGDHLNSLHVAEYTDEDLGNLYYIVRFEYWNEFWWIETLFWVELIICFFILRWIGESYSHYHSKVSYNLSNLEFWPILEEIDFVLAIPHWYLRPLMGSLVLIPHHYLGFFYVIAFFLFLIISPWANDFDNNVGYFVSQLEVHVKSIIDLNYIHQFFYFIFLSSLLYVTLIVPTGKYFISVGSSEMLIFSYWYIIIYLTVLLNIGPYIVYLTLYVL